MPARWRASVRIVWLRRCLVPREFGLVQLELFRDRSCDTGTCAQPLVIGFHCGPFRKLDRRCRHGPVDDERLQRIYAVALDIYLSGEAGPRGCFTVMTAASEAVADQEIRTMVLEGFSELDKAFAACFRLAKEQGELPKTADPVVLAQLASATIHTIAIRARARVPRKELEAIVRGAIEVMCAALG
jgi:tetracycline repressor-like protein